MFWRKSSPTRQRSALNSAIFRIKQQLAKIDGIYLISSGPVIVLRFAPSVKIDSRDFAEIVHSISIEEPMSEATAESLYKALQSCSAPYMDGVSSDWVLAERERFFNLQIRGMTILMHWLGQNRRYEDALEIGRNLLTADPAREAAQCEVMWLYVLNGQRAQALRQYQEFSNWLKRELDIEPMLETQALYNYIRSDFGVRNQGSSTGEGDLQSHRNAFNHFLGAIERSRRDLYNTLISPPH